MKISPRRAGCLGQVERLKGTQRGSPGLISILFLCIALLITGCDEQILHDLTEQDANKVLSRLGSGNLNAKKVVQSDGRWSIAVPRDAVVPALAYLDTNRILSPRSPGNTAGSKGSFVPSREEQWFRYERSVAVSIEDSLSTVSGVLEARVHLNLPETDPLFGTRKESIGSGSVLLIVDSRYGSKDEEIAALVAGAAGVPAAKVTVLKSQAYPQQSEGVVEVAPAAQAGLGAPSAAAPTVHMSRSSSLLTADVGLASAAFVALVGTGAVLFTRRRKKVKFVLPGGDNAEA